MDKYEESKRVEEREKEIKEIEDDLKIIKYYCNKLEKMCKCYRCFLTDLNNNAMPNYTDRMRKIKKTEEAHGIDNIFRSLFQVLRHNEENVEELKKHL